MKFSGPYNQTYENPAFSSYYEFGHRSKFNPMEWRLKILYDRLMMNVYPWQWDWENYTGVNSDMMGFFYPEDINAVDQVRIFDLKGESARNK